MMKTAHGAHIRQFALLLMICWLSGLGMPAYMPASAHSPAGGVIPRLFLPFVLRSGPGLPPLLPQCVDCPKNISVMSNHSLQMDKNNYPHIAYGNDHLYHAWFDGLQWKYETVDPTAGTGLYASLAFDKNDRPGIAYMDTFNHTLKFARWIGSAWLLQTVDGPTSSNTYPTLVFDSQDSPMVAYIADFNDTSAFQVKFARWNGSMWSVYPAVDTGTGYFPSLALDLNGAPHIAYFRDDFTRSGGLMYASWTGSAWSLQVVDEDSYKGKDNCLAFDSLGKPHISYWDDWDGVKYASWNGSAWVTEMIDTGVAVDALGQTSLAFAAGDVPLAAVALGSGDSHLTYLYKRASGGGWFRDYIGVGRFPSLAVTPDGKPHASFFDYEQGALRYASLEAWAVVPPYTWKYETIDYGAQVGQGVSAAVDRQGQPHVAYMDLTHGLLKYATLEYGFWKTSSVDVPGIVPAHGHSIALDPMGRPHIAYVDYKTKQVMYASYDGKSWTAEVVAPDQAAGMDDIEKYISLAIDGAGVPHISYYHQYNLDLKLASKSGANWAVEEVDKLPVGITGIYNALALDSLGRSHISYMDNKNNQLMYAFWNGTSWTKLVADSAYTSGMNTAIAVDSANHPHICYSDYIGYFLKYAYYNGAGWEVATLTPNTRSLPDNRQPACSIKIGPGNVPYISYFERASQHLMITHKSGTGWVSEIVDANGDNGEHNALVMVNGIPYIGYYGRSVKDLLFVRWRP